MALPVWGQLPKSQIDPERIEEAIERIVKEHEDDPEAHLGTNQSLQSHKASEVIDHLARSIIADKIARGEIWEEHRHSVSAWARRLATDPSLATEMNLKQWTDPNPGPAMHRHADTLAFDGEFIYASRDDDPRAIYKIHASTMETEDVIIFPAGTGNISSLLYDGNFLYAMIIETPLLVKKIDPKTMTEVSQWEGDSVNGYGGGGMISDGNFLYVAEIRSEARVYKIDPATMFDVDHFEGTDGVPYYINLAFDGIYLYALSENFPVALYKIKPADMSKVDEWQGDEYDERDAAGLVFDGGHLYFKTNFSWCDRINKLDPGTMTIVDTYQPSTCSPNMRQGTYDGKHLYWGENTNPLKIYRIDPQTMDLISVWTGAPGQNGFELGITFDGQFVFFCPTSSPTRVFRKIFRTINETGT